MSPSAIVENESAIIERLLSSPESAQAILALQFPPEDQTRMQELLDKNNKGALTEDEKEEKETYRRLNTFLGILQARARLIIQNQNGS